MTDISNKVVLGLTGRQLITFVQKYNLEDVRLATDQYLIFEIDERELDELDCEGYPVKEYTDLIINLNNGFPEFNTWDSRI